MIRNDREYERALERASQEKARFAQHAELWKSQGYTQAEVEKLLEPLESFHQQLIEEIESYERLKNGEFKDLENFQGIGQLLIGLRIANKLSQRELAQRLGIDESQVSRDERNEYHGLTLDRAQRVLQALGARLRTRVERCTDERMVG